MTAKKGQSGGLKESKKKTQKRLNFILSAPEAKMCFWQEISIAGMHTPTP